MAYRGLIAPLIALAITATTSGQTVDEENQQARKEQIFSIVSYQAEEFVEFLEKKHVKVEVTSGSEHTAIFATIDQWDKLSYLGFTNQIPKRFRLLASDFWSMRESLTILGNSIYVGSIPGPFSSDFHYFLSQIGIESDSGGGSESYSMAILAHHISRFDRLLTNQRIKAHFQLFLIPEAERNFPKNWVNTPALTETEKWNFDHTVDKVFAEFSDQAPVCKITHCEDSYEMMNEIRKQGFSVRCDEGRTTLVTVFSKHRKPCLDFLKTLKETSEYRFELIEPDDK